MADRPALPTGPPPFPPMEWCWAKLSNGRIATLSRLKAAPSWVGVTVRRKDGARDRRMDGWSGSATNYTELSAWQDGPEPDWYSPHVYPEAQRD